MSNNSFPSDVERRNKLKELLVAIVNLLTDIQDNGTKESILILDNPSIEKIFSLSETFQCTAATRHLALGIYASFLRNYHLQRKKRW